MKIQYFYLFIIVISLSSCFPLQQVQLEDLSKENLNLPFYIDEITIIDSRDTLRPMNWEVPALSTKSREWIGNPEISSKNKQDIETIIMRTSKESGVPAQVKYRVIEGECKLISNWKSVTEYAKFKGEVTLFIPSRNYTYKSFAVMYYDNPTVSGTEKGTMRLYNQAVKNVTHVALKEIMNEIEANKDQQ